MVAVDVLKGLGEALLGNWYGVRPFACFGERQVLLEEFVFSFDSGRPEADRRRAVSEVWVHLSNQSPLSQAILEETPEETP